MQQGKFDFVAEPAEIGLEHVMIYLILLVIQIRYFYHTSGLQFMLFRLLMSSKYTLIRIIVHIVI